MGEPTTDRVLDELREDVRRVAALTTSGAAAVLMVLAGVATTPRNSIAKLSLGTIYLDPSKASKLTLKAFLETTAPAQVAFLDLYRLQGGASQASVTGSQIISAALTPTLVQADLSTALRGQPAGWFRARLWCTPAAASQFVTCSGAWVEVVS